MKPMKIVKFYIIDEEREVAGFGPVLLADHVECADRFFTRLRGLLGRTDLPEGHGLLLSPCGAIHCSGMKFSIDAVFLSGGKDGEFQVLRVAEHLAPGARAAHKGAKHVLELTAGRAEARGLREGQRIAMDDGESR